jgi:hypothetical protein
VRRRVRGELYCHELVRARRGGPSSFWPRRAQGEAAYGGEGLVVVPSDRHAGRRRCAAVGVSRLGNLGRVRAGVARRRGELDGWRGALLDLGASWERTVLVDSALAPLRIGRQPGAADRRPLDEIG